MNFKSERRRGAGGSVEEEVLRRMASQHGSVECFVVKVEEEEELMLRFMSVVVVVAVELKLRLSRSSVRSSTVHGGSMLCLCVILYKYCDL